MRLGIPGIDFITESKRFYPGMNEAAHILGSTNVDNQGIAGIERHMDGENVALLQELGLARGNALAPVELSVDMRPNVPSGCPRWVANKPWALSSTNAMPRAAQSGAMRSTSHGTPA